MLLRLSALLHPLLLSIAPVLLLAAGNIEQIELHELWLPGTFVLILALIASVVWWLLIRNVEKAAILTSLSMMMFLLHGHVYGAIYQFDTALQTRHLHLVLLLVWLAVIGLTWLGLFHWKWKTEEVTKFITVAAVILLVMGIVQLGSGYRTKMLIAEKSPVESVLPFEPVDNSQRTAPNPNSDLPDIYYLILDGYGRHDQLNKCYGYSNIEFLQFLKDKGFYVADHSHSNYAHTFLSVASSLNLRFVASEIEGIRKHGKFDCGPFFDLIRNNDVGRYLQAKGYRFIHFNTWWAGTERSESADISYAGTPIDLSEFCLMFIRTTMLDAIAHAIGLHHAYAWNPKSAEHHLYCFKKLKEIPRVDVPTFTFCHIICPHAPYFFNRNGIAPDADSSSRDTWKNRKAYIEQLIFLNKQLRGIVDAILADSDRPPIIILQADHGTASLVDRTIPFAEQPDAIEERMSILNAFYVPDSCRRNLYESISPVNTFRVLFNSLFEAKLPLLPDRVFFSWRPDYLHLIDVTAGLNITDFPECRE